MRVYAYPTRRVRLRGRGRVFVMWCLLIAVSFALPVVGTLLMLPVASGLARVWLRRLNGPARVPTVWHEIRRFW